MFLKSGLVGGLNFLAFCVFGLCSGVVLASELPRSSSEVFRSNDRVEVRLQTEPLDERMLSVGVEQYFGQRGGRGLDEVGRDRRLANVEIFVDGRPVVVRASMFADLANPDIASVTAFRRRDSVLVRFRGGGNVDRNQTHSYEIELLVLITESSMDAVQRRVCDISMRGDSCVMTFATTWVPD
jgi:hypothetical protein